jgi:uncharacterized protein YjiS (DUF1127 family)
MHLTLIFSTTMIRNTPRQYGRQCKRNFLNKQESKMTQNNTNEVDIEYANFPIDSAQEFWSTVKKQTLVRVFNTMHTWNHRSKSRISLAHLSPQLLDDAGITEEQRQSEISKPFWEA